MRTRGLQLIVATLATTATVFAATPAAAAAGPHHELTPSFVASTDAFTPDSTRFYPSGFLGVGSTLDDEGDKHTNRIHLGFDVGGTERVRLSKAVLVIGEAHVNDCTKPRALRAQATQAFTGQHTWNNPPETLGSQVDGVARSTACATTVDFDVTEQLSRALRRGESRLWLKLQVPGAKEQNVAFGRTLYGEFRLQVKLTNTPPNQPVGTAMQWFDQPCPGNFWFSGNASAYAPMRDADRNPSDQLTPEFEFWSEADPTKKTPMTWSISSGGNGLAGVGDVPVMTLSDGRHAWHARVYDQRTYSAWSEPCPFNVDRTAPGSQPTVASPDYPENPPNPTGGAGQEGMFLFTANGVADVVAFVYGTSEFSMYNRVPADQLGGAATIRYRPFDVGPQSLFVASVDRAGNRSPAREYRFSVRDLRLNAWSVSQTPDPSGAGMAVEMHFSTQAGNGMTTVEYRVDDNGPAGSATIGADGTVNAVIAPLRGGEHLLHFSGRDANGNVLVALETYFYVDDSPEIVSDGVYPIEGAGGGVGITGTFTVRPRVAANAVAVRYNSTQSEVVSVPIGADGTAQAAWTPTEAGWAYFWFTVEYADGTLSAYRSFSVTING